ncbi:MAG TPA: AmmeMemoRadiSam system protein A [Acidobacteriota bacterium]|nr:AmmeMemoRadiSam system protein A [Acidobacteriota bacterium]
MSAELTRDEERALLGLARRAIENHFAAGGRLRLEDRDPAFKEKRGAFVTLKIGGELRGCIGYPLPYKALDEAVAEMAVAAASQDYRFEPLTPEELERTTIEISVLTVPRTVGSPDEVEVGRHGIIVGKGSRQGLLLPQVPLEYGWSREEFLRHGCLKAGLPPDEWKKGARIEVFEARVFSEGS